VLWRRISALSSGVHQESRCFQCHVQEAFDWRPTGIAKLQLGAVPQNFYSQIQIGLGLALYIRILLYVENFDLSPSSQYIVVSVIPSRFRFGNMRLRFYD
jgi:hypothetical protein